MNYNWIVEKLTSVAAVTNQGMIFDDFIFPKERKKYTTWARFAYREVATQKFKTFL